MRAAVYRGVGRIEIEDVPRPAIGPGEILIAVEACGVCPTDIKKIQKGLLPAPRIFGHEMAGVVAEVGRGVIAFREGDRVVAHHHVPCGDCFYCDRGAFAQCAHYKRNGTTAGFEPSGGGFAEYVRAMDWIVERGILRIPDGVDFEEAAFVEPVNTCLKAVENTCLQADETALIVGQGPIGLILMQLARLRGAKTVVSDMLADRLDMGRRLGAERTVDASEDVPAAVRSWTDGRGADCAFLAAPGPVAFAQAVAATRPAGRVMVFSATSKGEKAEVELGLLCTSEKRILTAYSSSIDLQETSAQLVFQRKVRVKELITHRFSLEQTARAVEIAAQPCTGVLKAMIEIRGQREKA
ncbi:MAG: zinc-dependent dehydrogenase [Vicinamibacteria bacterium]|nr:zinc-dependent dehydrogenase [Vicinamibacteria bacterium]